MNPIPIMPERLDWSSAIGLFLINFGTLDYFVFVFLKDHLPPEEFARVKDWHLKDRLSRIAQHLKDENHPVAEQTALAQLMERLEPIRELRNHLAHGHMYVRLAPLTQKPTVTVFQAKDVDTGWMPDSKHVEFAELLAGLKTLNGLIELFQQLDGFKEAASPDG